MNITPTSDPTPKTHIDPYGAEFGIACLYCGRVHRTRTERRDIRGRIVKDVEGNSP